MFKPKGQFFGGVKMSVNLLKTVYPQIAKVGETVQYKLELQNLSCDDITGGIIKDIDIPSSLLVCNIALNGIKLGGSANLVTGIEVGCVPVNRCAILTFEATVLDGCESQLENVASFCGKNVCCETIEVESNCCILTVLDPEISICKTANTNVVTEEGQVIVYTLTVTNTGNTTLKSVCVTDRIPQGLLYVPCSTQINCGPYFDDNPEDGVLIGILEPCEVAVVEFSVEVASTDHCQPFTRTDEDGSEAIVESTEQVSACGCQNACGCKSVQPKTCPNGNCFINVAQVEGRYTVGCENKTFKVRAASEPWVIMNNIEEDSCFCQDICHEYRIRDLCEVQEVFLHHHCINVFLRNGRTCLDVKYGICLEYTDCFGCRKNINRNANVFFELPCETYYGEPITVQMINPPCVEQMCNLVTVRGQIQCCTDVSCCQGE